MNQTIENLGITPKNLNDELAQQKPLLLFDLRTKEHFEESHIDGSVHAVCDVQAKKKIMPKIPKNTKIILISEPEELAKETAQMIASFGLDSRYLVGGFHSWKGKLAHGPTGKTITADHLAQKLDKVLLLDIRDNDEFTEYKIPG